jgi:cation:H+ antiporter
VIGSSIFNILAATGISALVRPLSAMAISKIDLYFLLGIALLLTPFVKKSYILKRDEGIFMVGMYLIYMYYLWPK